MNVLARFTELLSLGSQGRQQRIGLVRTFIKRSDETGGAMVEMALCLPILLIIVTGMASFGLALNNYIMLTNAVEIGARQLAISRGQLSDPCSSISSVISSASPLLKAANLTYTFNLNGTSYTGSAARSCTAGAAQLVQGTAVSVQATYPCSLLIYGKNVVPGCTLSAQTTELEQ